VVNGNKDAHSASAAEKEILIPYRYNPAEVEKKTKSKLEELSPVEKEVLERLSQAFGIKVYIRTREDGKLIALHHG